MKPNKSRHSSSLNIYSTYQCRYQLKMDPLSLIFVFIAHCLIRRSMSQHSQGRENGREIKSLHFSFLPEGSIFTSTALLQYPNLWPRHKAVSKLITFFIILTNLTSNAVRMVSNL